MTKMVFPEPYKDRSGKYEYVIGYHGNGVAFEVVCWHGNDCHWSKVFQPDQYDKALAEFERWRCLS